MPARSMEQNVVGKMTVIVVAAVAPYATTPSAFGESRAGVAHPSGRVRIRIGMTPTFPSRW
eukprot:6366242-Pyramimonas_sp.AAC.1